MSLVYLIEIYIFSIKIGRKMDELLDEWLKSFYVNFYENKSCEFISPTTYSAVIAKIAAFAVSMGIANILNKKREEIFLC